MSLKKFFNLILRKELPELENLPPHEKLRKAKDQFIDSEQTLGIQLYWKDVEELLKEWDEK